MQLDSAQSDEDIEMDMTPMIDVVFLLIIFFMVVSEITKLQSKENIVLPLASESRPDNDPKHLLLNIDSIGNVWSSGKRFDTLKKEDLVALNRLLKKERELDIVKRGGNPADPKELCDRALLIRVDKFVEYIHIARVMIMCQKNKIWKLSFGAKPFTTKNDNADRKIPKAVSRVKK